MKRSTPLQLRTRSRLRRGFTIVEAMLATVIVAVALAASVSGAVRSISMRARIADRARAQQLAMDLVAEILQQTYAAPATPDPLGPTRAGWTCVDDYGGLAEAAPVTRVGTAIPDTGGWSRGVTIQSVDPASMQATAASDLGIKMITVTVRRGTLILASASAYRTLGWGDAGPSPDDATGNHPTSGRGSRSGRKGPGRQRGALHHGL